MWYILFEMHQYHAEEKKKKKVVYSKSFTSNLKFKTAKQEWTFLL